MREDMNRNSLLYKILKPCYDGVWDAYCYIRRKPYVSQVRQLIDDDTSIITSNCFAGRIMQDLGMKYNTPTLGLYFMYPDYIEFLQHLENYLTEAKIQFVEHSKYPLGDERRADWTNKKHWYPIGLLDGKVEVHFLHYHSEEEAATKWYRRAKRVNFDKLLVIGMDQNLCTEKDMVAFDELPFQKKVFFSSKPLKGKCILFMKEFAGKGQVGDPYRKAHLFYKYLINQFLDEKKSIFL